MNLDKLMKYDFARDFVEGKLSERKFLDKLIEKVDTDKTFRENTGIISLETKDLNEVIYELKKYSKRKYPTRRRFIGLLAGTGAVAATATGSAKYFGWWPFASNNDRNHKPEAERLFEEFNRIPKLMPIIPTFSKNPEASTIILVEDLHGGTVIKGQEWYVKFEKLELLRKGFGLNFVGIEGWAGHEADRARGRQILNADKTFIREILKNKSYNVIGLEEPEIQIKSIEFSLVELIASVYRYEKEIHDYLSSRGIPDSNIKDSIESIYFHTEFDEIISSLVNSSPIAKNNPSIKNEIAQKLVQAFGSYIFTLNIIISALAEVYKIKEFNRKVLEGYKSFFQRKYPNLFAHYYKQTEEPSEVQIVRKLREQHAVNKMFKSMNDNNKKIGIVVFGAGHSDGLIKEFLKQKGEINIILLKNKFVENLIKKGNKNSQKRGAYAIH